MKTVGDKDYTHQMEKISKFNTIKCAQIGGADLLCVEHHYAKVEYKEMKYLELQITQTRHNQSIFDIKISKFNTPQK